MDEAIQVYYIIDKLPPSWKDFKHALKHLKEELTLVELGSHLCIKESLRVQDSNKPKGNNVVGPLLVNMVEHNNSSRMMMLRSGLTQEQQFMCVKIDDEALDKFKVFKTEVELQQGSQIKRFRTDRGGPSQRAVVRLPDSKLKNLGERGIECIFVGYVEHSKAFRFYVIEPNDSVSINSIIESRDAIFDENRFSSVLRPSQRSLVNETEDIGFLVIPEEVTEEAVQQPEPELRKSKRNRTPKDFGP
ncbi:hypothetical protein Tco_0320356 [Tanacetum coccineum]